MCGFAGFVGSIDNPQKFLSSAAKSLHRRGPDGFNFESYGWAGLAHTRLSLIDLSSNGNQPMHSDKFSLVFNGEIYNWKSIKAQLLSFNVQFKSESDTEVLLHALVHFGLTETLALLRGIFAFALLDKRKQEITLVRDRFGTKPLYFAQERNCLKFASTIEALATRKTVSKRSLEEYLTFQNILPPNTLFENIFNVKPGSAIKYSLLNNKFEEYEWANLRSVEPTDSSFNDNVEAVNTLLVQSVQRNLVADVPVGAFLSGGLDSGLIASIASGLTHQLNTFSIGFETDTTFEDSMFANEVQEARELSVALRVPNYSQILKSQDMWDLMSQIAEALEEPRVGQSYPNFFASKLAATINKAVMAGTGGDEFFGGYPWRYSSALDPRFENKSSQLQSLVSLWHRLVSMEELSKLLGISFLQHKDFTYSLLTSVLEENSLDNHRYTVRDLMYFDMKMFLHGLLHVEDKLSMWHGLEVRVPFLDEDLVNFSLTIPVDHLVWHSPTGNFGGKAILREISTRMGIGIENRKKQGFTGPDSQWFKDGSRINDLLSSDSKIWDLLDYAVAQSVIHDHFSGKRNARLFIWSLIQLEMTLGRK